LKETPVIVCLGVALLNSNAFDHRGTSVEFSLYSAIKGIRVSRIELESNISELEESPPAAILPVGSK
jgi:hypothetical protein